MISPRSDKRYWVENIVLYLVEYCNIIDCETPWLISSIRRIEILWKLLPCLRILYYNGNILQYNLLILMNPRLKFNFSTAIIFAGIQNTFKYVRPFVMLLSIL